MVPFGMQESSLTTMTYYVLDSIVRILKENPAITISIDGHANLAEGAYSFCMKLAEERASIVKNYLVSRMVNTSRILEVRSSGISKPVNAAKTPLQVLKNARAEIWLNGIPKPVPDTKPEIPFIK